MRTVSWSYLAPRAPTTPAVSSHYRVPALIAQSTSFADDAPTPGVVADEQLVAGDPTTPTEPTPTPTEPTPTEPTGPSVPEQPTPPAVDPALDAPILQVTEVAPDTANVGGSDGYEFIEVYNASESPVRWRDFTISYLYIDASHVITSSALWPSVPDDTVVEPGQVIVLWVKNAANQALTAEDFNAHWGSRLTAGTDLLEMQVGGMANGGPRGIQVRTNTGHEISRADYMSDAETVADQPIQYRWESGTVQTQVGIDTASPGYTAPSQVPSGLVGDPANDEAPEVVDLRGGPEVPVTDDLELAFDVTDDHQVRTVALTLDTDVDEPVTHQLAFDGPNRYYYTVPDVDLYGKKWIEYSVVARDGANTTTYGPVRITLQTEDPAPVRLNVRDGQFVGGDTRIAGSTSGDPSTLGLRIDGTDVGATVPTLEKAPLFAFEATNTDAFFRNGVKLGDDVLTIFDEGFYSSLVTVPSEIPVDRIAKGEPLTVSVWSGTKGYPELSTDDNNDDFTIRNLRLALPDGRVLRPELVGVHATNGATAYDPPVRTTLDLDPTTSIAMGDGSSTYDYVEATFAIPDDAFDSQAYVWDTTTAVDGEHAVTATVGEDTLERTVVVDNTRPTVTTPLEDGRTYRGDLTVDASAEDAGSGVDRVTATLDGAAVTLPYATSSVELDPGSHVLVVKAADALGNTTTRTITFATGDESSSVDLGGPDDGSEVRTGDVTLEATPTSAEGDDLSVSFRTGFTYDPADAAVESYAGTTTEALTLDRDDRTLLTDDDLDAMVGADGVEQTISSDSALPYQLFTVNVPDDAGDDATVRLAWSGSANADAKVLMYVLDTADESWQEVDRHVTTDAEDESAAFELAATVAVADHVVDGELTVLVQHSEGFAGTDRSDRGSAVTPYHQGATPRQDYDFTIGWESDTQYYNENQGWKAGDGNPETFYRHQRNINQFFLDERDNLNLQYVLHTGDIVDDHVATVFSGDNDDPEYEWKNADPAYRAFDEAGLPYGVLAGNHDVGHAANDYSMFGKWFGADRYASNPWYGGQIQNNRGHYDLVSAGGIDFLVLSMGWGPGDEQIAWMNSVIRQYPERKVWINLHEYLLTTGTLGPIPQRIFDEVVTPNPNVFAVSSGHYHDAYTRTDDFDDDGDGTPDRTVYSMLFDYQGLPEGGLGYLRLLHFDNEQQRIVVRTYSPSLEDFDSDDVSLNDPPGQQEFEIPYVAVGLEPRTKSLATDAFRADVLTTQEVDAFDDVPSGSSVEAVWRDVEAGEHGWYVRVSGPYGGVHDSEVHTFTATAAGELTAATPVVAGTVAVGSTLVANAGEWGPDGVELSYRWYADGAAIAGADDDELALGAALVGRRITVEVTGALDGYASVSRTSEPTPPVARGTLVAGTPRITGSAALGRTLTVHPGTWRPAGVRLGYQWYANGRAIRGRTGTRLALGPALVGKRITVRVTATLHGYVRSAVTSAAAGPVAPGRLVGPRPRIAGKPRVGNRVRAANVRWRPAPVRIRYQWLAGKKVIRGADGPSLRVRKGLLGKRLRLRVTVSKPGYRTVEVRSARSARVRG
ncbi:metallophosphoesterase [Mumia flava]